ncbi:MULTISPECIES: hypothetical protein [unclassified Sinorhizobium]|uniref:hypothetical protein n=1 Tax=unclassified Sinorhizobium TaxID=2613772 RepID=UPI0035261F93
MRNSIMSCAAVMLSVCSFAAPAMADSVYIDRDYDRYDRVRPGITINERGVQFGVREERPRYRYRDRCITRTVTREDEYGERYTETERRCR